jgi:hypothetical protein
MSLLGTLHNFCQRMPKPMVCDIWTQGDPMVGFASMRISVPQEGEGAKITNVEIWDPLFT